NNTPRPGLPGVPGRRRGYLLRDPFSGVEREGGTVAMIEPDAPVTPPPARVPVAALASQLLDRVEAAVMIVAVHGTVLYANPYCELVYGRRPEDLTGTLSESFAAHPIPAELRAEIGRALAAGRSWEGDFKVLRGDGATVVVHAIDSPVFDENGSMT